MNQHQLNRAVAAATGETVGFVRSMDFSPLALPVSYRPHWRQRRSHMRGNRVHTNGLAHKSPQAVQPS